MRSDHTKQRAKNILYKDLPEEKKEELRRKDRERYAKKKASSSNSLQLKDSTSFGGDQLTTSIDELSNDDVQRINIIQDFTVLQKVSKRQRIFRADVDINELSSCHEVCVPPAVNVCVVDSEATSSLNNVTDQSNCPSDSMDFLTRKSGNTYIDETTVSNQFLIQQAPCVIQEQSSFETSIPPPCRGKKPVRGIAALLDLGNYYKLCHLKRILCQHELENRISDSDRMNPSIIAQLIDILRINPYSIFFRSLGDLPNLENQVIHIRSDAALNRKRKDPVVSCREYYCYKLQIRENVRSILLLSGRLLQQFVVDMYVKIETSRLDYFRSKQQHIRSELYQGIVDTITLGEADASKVGKRIILPSSFIRGPRDMRKRYMEAMALVQRYGKPDIFLTMTCNPNWQEISNELRPHEESQNRPDLVAWVFRAKLEELKDRLFKQQIFGKVSAYVYVIEHQKRGLPHAHFLIILQRDWKLYAPESFDEIVSAEIPDKNTNLHLHNAVINHMMHGPCGVLNPTNVCMKKNGCCKSQYPKSFASSMTVGNDCFPIYKRSDNGIIVKVRGHNLDNCWVVPYNPYLLATFDCHINVEICSTIKAVKYLYKYIYKGHDRVAFNLVSEQNNQQIDEIQQFQSARWIAPPEAMWRIYGFIVNEMYPAVYSLHLHLEDQHQVTFRENENLINVLNSDRSAKSMLTEFFALNRVDENARTLLYKEFPEFYVWSQQYKQWTHLRTVDGVVAPTFRETATMHGLLQRDNSLEDCLHEASLYQMPSSLRRLFATILVYCNPTNPRELWEHFEQDMSVDFRSTEDSMLNVRMQVLRSISFTLESMGKDINSFHLLDDNICFDEDQVESREIDDELAVEIPEEDIVASEALNSKQRHVYNSVLGKVFSNEAATFFVDGPGGTGKTFLYKALLAAVRSRKLVALATASSGVAASILPGGRTAHSRFKIPLDTDEHSMCCVSKQSAIAKLLRVARLIIWDEAPMSRKQHIEALDKMLRDINDSELTFGGKVIVFGGDFRQVLPVVRKGTRQEHVDASLVSSYLWPTLIKFHLTENMRARLDLVFSEYVLELGNGMPPITVDETIKIPDGMLVSYEDDCTSLDHLIDAVFHDIHEYSINISAMMNRAILTPKNSYVDEINALLIHRFPGEIKRYYSFDEAIDASEQSVMEDFLNTLTPNGLPPHELLLKINSLKMQTVYTSIKDITPSTRDWKIKMIVAEKSPKRTGQRSPVKYQSLTLIDPEENRLQATIFDKDIDSL
ncbi:uncharacterized protein LOC122291181 [Carya illinoinensis]|uniref:uncharacterized protein LOC122291181 n=1 Tax=Carya illinoinensis TaxID=32201 RepID=UPI001C718C09|nr:uncharacterized protein LOC122291181 [Carya illinoinensis]